MQPAFSSAMVLLVDILATKHAHEKQGLYTDVTRDASVNEEPYPTWEKEQDVERCMKVLAHAESRWYFAGRLHDILREFQRSGQILAPEASHTQQTGSGPGLAPFSGPSWVPQQPPLSAATSISNYPATTDRHFAPSEYGSSGVTGCASVLSEAPHPMSSGPYGNETMVPSYEHPPYLNRPAYNHSMTYPFSSTSYDQPNTSHLDSTNLVHPNPTDPYRYDIGAYLPDASYGGDLSVPFPGIVPQLNFAPNHGQEDLLGAGFEELSHETNQNSEWTTNVQPSSSDFRASQWELMNNTLNFTGGPPPPENRR
ncbi:hypothetical protein FRC07_003698 [Ceratobasidium sp. 392]|nr:hypothetical protein FRC07_003698 [Ceratobasidium sp. 392]